VLYESNAILTYLAEKHGWTDLYPADIKARYERESEREREREREKLIRRRRTLVLMPIIHLV
jgi:glutathione S-transferase